MERPFVLTGLQSIIIRSSGLLIVNIIMLTTMIDDAIVQCTIPEENETEREKGGGGERVPRGQVSKTPSPAPQCTKAIADFKDILIAVIVVNMGT